MAANLRAIPDPAGTVEVLDVQQTTCCIVGGGPGGIVLGLLLARQGVGVTLLEMHKDFDREFRGDTLHPAILEILAEVGLTERLHQLRHVKLHSGTLLAADAPFTPFDFRRLKTRFPYIMFMPQEIFLEFLAAEARKYSQFRLLMRANVQQLVEEDGVVRGVRYLGDDGWHEVRALLTVGADGRFSRLRHLAGFEPIKTSPPFNLMWFRLPRLPEDPQQFTSPPSTSAAGSFMLARGSGHPEAWLGMFGGRGKGVALFVFDRLTHWQVGYFLRSKEHYQELRATGLEAFRRSIVEIEPRLARHVEHLQDWRQLALLTVESSRCPQWYKPGLLLIGDAAHVMSPAAGAGIKYAIEDAVVAANVLAGPLKAGQARLRDLAEVQRQRQWPTRFIQAAGAFAQRNILPRLLHSQERIRVPRFVRLLFQAPILRDLFPRALAFGIWKVHVRTRGDGQ